MKVLLIDVNCKYSSTGKIVYDLYTELNHQGHTASIAYGRGSRINEANIFKYGYDIETVFHALMTRITGLTGYFSWFSTRRLLQHLKTFQPDVVHLHDLHGYHVNIGTIMNYLKTHGIKTIWTFHSEFMYTGKCGHAKDCIGFESTCGNCPLLREYPKSLLLDFTTFMLKQKKEWFNDWDNLTLTTPSNWMKYRVKRSFLSELPLVVVENALDTKIFNLNLKNDFFDEQRKFYSKIVLSIIPNLSDEAKGYDWITNIADNEHFQSFLFVIVTKEVKKQRDQKNVFFIPFVNDQAQLARIYSSVDLFLITSKYESYSMTTLEATSCGLPVVGFAVGGVPEATQGNVDFLVNYGDTKIIDAIILSTKSDSLVEIDYDRVSSVRMLEEYFNVYSS